MPGRGEQFRINAKRKFSSNLGSLLFLAVWNAAIAAMIHFDAPWGFPAFFILIDLLLIAASIDYFFGRSSVSVNATGVQVRKEWLGRGRRRLAKRDRSRRSTARARADTVAARMMADLGR